MIGFALLLIFTPDIQSLEKLRYLNTYIMLGFLGLGMVLLLLGEKRLMFASLICCGLLCIFLKSVSNKHIVLPETNDLPDIKLAHFNLGNYEGHPDSIIKILDRLNVDILSFQEFTPAWNMIFKNTLENQFDYFSKDVRIDPYGMCIFSEYPIKNAGLYYHNDIPNFKCDIVIEGKTRFSIFTSYILPPFQQSNSEASISHLKAISDKVNTSPNPSLMFGDFNMVYWAEEILEFRSNAGLSNSRRESNIFFNQSYDHMFFSEELECTQFDEIVDQNNKHIGIIGTYQIKSEEELKTKHILSIR